MGSILCERGQWYIGWMCSLLLIAVKIKTLLLTMQNILGFSLCSWYYFSVLVYCVQIQSDWFVTICHIIYTWYLIFWRHSTGQNLRLLIFFFTVSILFFVFFKDVVMESHDWWIWWNEWELDVGRVTMCSWTGQTGTAALIFITSLTIYTTKIWLLEEMHGHKNWNLLISVVQMTWFCFSSWRTNSTSNSGCNY